MKRLRGYLWFVRRYGLVTLIRYERLRRRYVAFDPKVHGEAFLRHYGASEQAIAEAKRQGLA